MAEHHVESKVLIREALYKTSHGDAPKRLLQTVVPAVLVGLALIAAGESIAQQRNHAQAVSTE